MRESRSGETQRHYLDVARRGNASDVVMALWQLLERERLPVSELSTEWLALWDQVSESGGRVGPASVVERITHALADIQPVDKEIGDIRLATSQSVVLLLGAGASSPQPSSIPTVSGLLPELWRRARRVGREDIDRLEKWCQDHSITNIEDLLTAAYVANFSAKNAGMTGLLDYFLFGGTRLEPPDEGPAFRQRRTTAPRVDVASIAMVQDTLQILFGLLADTMIPAGPNTAHEAIASFLKAHHRTSIVTTNYDGCIDEALIRAKVPFQTLVDPSSQARDDAVDLVKIHGSINWAYCDSCQSVREFDLPALKSAYEDDTYSYAVIGICKTCSGQRRPLLVPPMAFNFIMFPNLIRLWETARQRIEDADYLIVVGYSFSEADTYVTKIVGRSMTAKKRQKIVVCDPNRLLVPNVRQRFAARIDNFDVHRVLQATGSCSDLLPGILQGLTTPVAQPSTASAQAEPEARRTKRRRSASGRRTS
jgi:NAD-dependent SIR2 family protein deacetylase